MAAAYGGTSGRSRSVSRRSIASYLAAERELGRVASDADVDTLAPTLIGARHLLFADRKGTPAGGRSGSQVATTVITGVVREPLA
ncbi:hypothetical protein [Microtetraspora fusca]|uniref:hypothetical protein n=1 Tax=Microtetraspora fusca TaxID=1997 RepID=UPI0008297D0E|nr:hypothetical protein [Microtetraspora fusca]